MDKHYPETEEDWHKLYKGEDPRAASVVPIPSDIVKQGPEAMIDFLERVLGKKVDEGAILLEFACFEDGTTEYQANYLQSKDWEIVRFEENPPLTPDTPTCGSA